MSQSVSGLFTATEAPVEEEVTVGVLRSDSTQQTLQYRVINRVPSSGDGPEKLEQILHTR